MYILYIFDYGKDFRCDLTNKFFSWILPIRKSFFTRIRTLFWIRESFFGKICSKIRQTQKFLSNISRSFWHAKVSAPKVSVWGLGVSWKIWWFDSMFDEKIEASGKFVCVWGLNKGFWENYLFDEIIIGLFEEHRPSLRKTCLFDEQIPPV